MLIVTDNHIAAPHRIDLRYFLLMPNAHYLPYRDTRRFSTLVLDYLDGKTPLRSFYAFRPDAAGLAAAIEARKRFPVDRRALVQALQEQYRHLPLAQPVEDNITLLADENTFTICTAHQPNLATGYLYFVYKILHAIKLAQALNRAFPAYRFVPVYYMGSEDADLDELGTFRFGDKKWVWDANGQTGAVGRMDTRSLQPLLQELFAAFPPGERADDLEQLLRQAYLRHGTIAKATQYLVHTLFGRYGLIALDPDVAALKQSFIPVMEDDLLAQTAERIVGKAVNDLTGAGYKAQAHPRAVNLFYLKDDIRERIERQGEDEWQVLGTGVHWNRKTLLEELHTYPERFSPNVMLRPLYQETILPDVAFIGGGAEVAYWLQLQALFGQHAVFYPAVLLRQSVMWVAPREAALQAKTGLDLAALFFPAAEAAGIYVETHSGKDIHTGNEASQLENLLHSLRAKANAVDATLARSADAALSKMKRQLEVLQHKMLRAEKRRLSTGLEHLSRLQSVLFPSGGLAERVENFMPHYLQLGGGFFDILLEAIEPLSNKFLVLEENVSS